MKLIFILLLLSGCGHSWTEESDSSSGDCSACYMVNDPIYGEGFVCSEDVDSYECDGLTVLRIEE